MRWKPLMIISLGGLLLLLVASYVTLRTIDFNRFKPRIILAVKEATGLAVALQGDIRVGLRPGFHVIINDIRIRNAEWGERAEMITIRRCYLDLAILPLIRGVLQIERLLFLEPDVLLETGAGGDFNLNLKSKGEKRTPILPVKQVMVEKGVLTYKDYRSGKSHLIQANRLRVAAIDQDAPVQVDFDGALNDTSLRAEAVLGSLASFTDPREPWSVQLKVEVEQSSLAVHGSVTDKDRLQGVSLNLHAQGQSLSKALAIGNIRTPVEPGPFTLSAKITDAGGNLSLKEIDLRAGTGQGVTASVSGGIENLSSLRGVHLAFRAHFKESSDFSGLPGKPFDLKGPLSVAGTLTDVAQEVYAATGLQLLLAEKSLTGSLALDLRGKRPRLKADLSSPQMDFQNVFVPDLYESSWMKALQRMGRFHLKFTLADPAGDPIVEDLDVDVGTAENAVLRVAGSINGLSSFRQAALSFTVHGKNAGEVGNLFEKQIPLRGPFVVSGKIKTPGANTLLLYDIQAVVGESKVHGSTELDLAGEKPVLRSELISLINDPENIFTRDSPVYEAGMALSRLGEAKWVFSVVDPGGNPSIEGLTLDSRTEGFARLEMRGSIGEFPAFRRIDLTFSAQGEDASRLQKLFGEGIPFKGPFSLSARFLDSKPRSYSFENLRALVGESEILGKAAISAVDDAFSVGAELSAQRIDPAAFEIRHELVKTYASLLRSLGPWNLALRATVSADAIAVEDLNLRCGHRDLLETTVTGSIRNLKAWQGLDVGFSIHGKDIKSLEKITGTSIPLAGSLACTGRLENLKEKTYRIRELNAILGDNDLEGSFDLNFAGDIPYIKGEILSNKLDLRLLFSRDTPDNKKMEGKVFPSEPLALDFLKVADANIQLSAHLILLPRFAFDNVRAGIALVDGRLEISPFHSAVGGGGAVAGSLDLRRDGDKAVTGLELRISRADFGAMLEELGAQRFLDGTMDAEINLQGRGASLAELMAGLDGKTLLAVSNGRIHNRAIEFLGASLLVDMWRMFNPFSKKEQSTPLHCHINLLEIKEGLAVCKVWVTDTKHTTVKGGGRVDLRNEKLELLFQRSPKKGIGISGLAELNLSLGELAKTFVVGGTLADPSLNVDPKGLAFGLGKMLGALALFGPFGVAAGLLDLKFGEDHPCIKAMEAVENGLPEETNPQKYPWETDPR